MIDKNKAAFLFQAVWEWIQADKVVELMPTCGDEIKIAKFGEHKHTMEV